MDERDAAIISIYAGHCLVKCANVVLSSRVLSTPRKQSGDKAKTWFSLDLEEVAPASAELSKWRAEGQQPLTLKIYLRTINDANSSEAKAPGCDEEDVLLEQWRLAYDGSGVSPRSNKDSGVSDRVNDGRMDKHSVYKKMIILTRSLYTYLRIMPAHRLFRAGQSAQSRSFDIVHKIVSGNQASGEDLPEDFNHFSFSNLNTPTGAVSIRVHYRPASMIDVLEETTHAQSLPRIIQDYINSPRQLLSLSESMQKAPVVVSTVSDTPINESTGQQASQPSLLYPHCWSSKELPTYSQPPSAHIAIPPQSAGCLKPNIPQGPRQTGHEYRRSHSRENPRVRTPTGDAATLRPRGLNPEDHDSVPKKIGKFPMEVSGVAAGGERSPAEATNVCKAKISGPHVSIPGTSCNEVLHTDQGLALHNGLSEDLDEKSPSESTWKEKDFNAEGICLSAQRSESSYTSISSSQLPFACTPPGLLGALESGSLGMGLCDPSPPISGRDISALAIIRRPSWSSRSFDMSLPKLSDPLDPWLASNSQANVNRVPVSRPSLAIRDSSLTRMIEWEKGLKSPANTMQASEKPHSFLMGSSESESLPFAIDGDGWNAQEGSYDDNCALGSYVGVGASGEGSASQSDAAVASFLRLMQDAPPLTSPGTSPSVSFERAREQLREFKVKVEGFNMDT